jgi:ribosomal protein S12 methylthiotransferase
MVQLLTDAGYRPVTDPRRALVIIVNTCGFIRPAREESLQVLADAAAKKKGGQVLIAAGCLTQRDSDAVTGLIPGIDGILGTRRWMEIVNLVGSLVDAVHPDADYQVSGTSAVGRDERGARCVSIQGASAYLKIADGCRRTCAFCTIPLIKGPAVSRPAASILSDAVYLQEKGVREIVLIAQDTTDYGRDLGLKNGLVFLLREMTAAAPRVDWIRVMYAYPGYITDELIEVMAAHRQIVPYLDIPLQHAHPSVLHRMQRPAGVDQVRRTLEKIRRAIPDLALRTTFIVGYPGETEEEFQTLLDFAAEIRFDRVGVFKFSFEPGTPGETLGDPVPDEIKEERRDRLMEVQQSISLERNRTFIGRDLDVLFEGVGQGVSVGRSYRDAPEIDGVVLVEGEMPVGQIAKVHITGASVYDLGGVAVHSTSRKV